MGVTGTAGFKKRLEEIQGMEQRAWRWRALSVQA